MQTVSLGNTGIQVSAMCLGTMTMGWRTPAGMSARLLDQYVEAGGTFLDTANIYGRLGSERVGGLSEEVVGRWMRERSNRSRLFIATKVGFEYTGVERGLPAARIAAECDKSLKRMGLETIDLYYAHVDDRATPMEETLEAFDRLVKAGKARFIGASNFSAWRLDHAQWVSRAHGWPEYCCIQQRHSYLRPVPGASTAHQIVANQDLLDYCQVSGVTLLAYSPLLGGAYVRADKALSKVYLGPDSDARLRALREVAHETGATPNQVVLAWMMHSTPRVVPVFSASNREQMAENLGALHLKLSAEQMSRLDSASGLAQN